MDPPTPAWTFFIPWAWTKRNIFWPPLPSSCPRSYWMTPNIKFFLYWGLDGIVTDTMCPKYRKKGFWEPPNGLCWTVFAQQHHGLCCGLPLKSWVALRPYINRQACMKVTLYDLWLSFWAFEGKVYDRNWIAVDCMKSNSNSLAKRFQKFPKVNKQLNKFFSKLSSRHLTKV